jgi:hypothetical protein
MSDARGLEADRYKSTNNATLFKLLEEMPIDTSPVWIKQFPSLSKIWQDPIGPYAPRVRDTPHARTQCAHVS